MKSFLKKNSIAIVFALAGSVVGFLYWKFVGCKTGSCPIKSNWYLMTGYGIIAGYLVGDIVSGVVKRRRKRSIEDQNTSG
jgi:hypothetical protein